MDKSKIGMLNEFEATSIFIGFTVGIGILSLPNSVVKYAKQDGWIAVALGGIYPLYLALLSLYYCKNHPDEDILMISRKYLGNFLGSICNIIFLLQWIIYMVFVTTGFSNVIEVYATEFLPPIAIFATMLFTALYLVDKGLNVIARVNKISTVLIIMIIMTLISGFIKGKIYNLQPITGIKITNLFKASMESVFSYAGMESIFLFYPYIKHKKKALSITLKASIFTILVYVFITIISIYYLGHNLVSKTLWPTLVVTESVNLPILNSFRYVFLLLWITVIAKLLTNEYYALIYCISDVIKVKNEMKISMWLYPFLVLLCTLIGNEVQRREYLDIIIPKVTLYNIFYITILAIFIFVHNIREKNSI